MLDFKAIIPDTLINVIIVPPPTAYRPDAAEGIQPVHALRLPTVQTPLKSTVSGIH